MKIGVLTFHWVYNFGANLQTCSTYYNILAKKHTPIIINWIPEDDEIFQKKITTEKQASVHSQFFQEMMCTRLCRNEKDIANVVVEEQIDGIIIGSDAVWNILKPRLSRTTLKLIKPLSDHIFPNPFWGSFESLLTKKVPLAALSVSNQNACYKNYKSSKTEIGDAIGFFAYISVRDDYTKKMVQFFNGNINPSITPDPVFAFNTVVHVPSKGDILKKYDLPENYVLFSFGKHQSFKDSYINSLIEFFEKKGYCSVNLKKIIGNKDIKTQKYIPSEISPIDWYSLIKYSCGYIGVLMHPIVVSLHNNVPFFAFDTYGKEKFFVFRDKKTSKTYDIISRAQLLKNYHSCDYIHSLPQPTQIFESIKNFEIEKSKVFSKKMETEYLSCLDKIIDSLEKQCISL